MRSLINPKLYHIPTYSPSCVFPNRRLYVVNRSASYRSVLCRVVSRRIASYRAVSHQRIPSGDNWVVSHRTAPRRIAWATARYRRPRISSFRSISPICDRFNPVQFNSIQSIHPSTPRRPLRHVVIPNFLPKAHTPTHHLEPHHPSSREINSETRRPFPRVCVMSCRRVPGTEMNARKAGWVEGFQGRSVDPWIRRSAVRGRGRGRNSRTGASSFRFDSIRWMGMCM